MSEAKLQVRRVETPSEKDIEDATNVWYDAFKDDVFVISASGGKDEFLRKFLYSTLIAGIRGGQVFFASYGDGPIVGAAVWYPPGRALLDSPDQGEGGFDDLLKEFTTDFREWWTKYFLPKYEVQNTETLGEGVKLGAWHLQNIGVSPPFQRRGVGTALVEHVQKTVQAEGKTLCLEVENEVNLKFYEGLGFVLRGKQEYENPIQNFPMWIMSIAGA